MTRKTSKASGKVGAVAALCLMAALLTPSSALADPAQGLVGAWRVLVTLRNCTTQAPLGPPVHALVTFHRGGTISESAGGVTFAPGQRSPGHGAWARKSGHTYQQDMVAMIVFDTEPNLPGTPNFDPTKPVSPGFFAGWVNRQPHGPVDGRRSPFVERDQRFLQVERRGVQDRLLDRNGRALLAGCEEGTAAGRRRPPPARSAGQKTLPSEAKPTGLPAGGASLRSSCRRSACGRPRNHSACPDPAALACWWRHPPGTWPSSPPALRSWSRRAAGSGGR